MAVSSKLDVLARGEETQLRRISRVGAGLVAAIAIALAAAQAVGPTRAQGIMPSPRTKLPRKQKEEPVKPLGPAEQQFPFGATWILNDINGKPVSGDSPSFTLDDKLRATGFGGCNTFSMALYPIKGQKLAAGAIAVLRKSCGKDLDDEERNLLVGLHSLPVWHLEANGDLTVTGQANTLHFRRGL